MTSARRTGVDQEQKKKRMTSGRRGLTKCYSHSQLLTLKESVLCATWRVPYRIRRVLLAMSSSQKNMVLLAAAGMYRTARARNAKSCPSVADQNSTRTTAVAAIEARVAWTAPVVILASWCRWGRATARVTGSCSLKGYHLTWARGRSRGRKQPQGARGDTLGARTPC